MLDLVSLFVAAPFLGFIGGFLMVVVAAIVADQGPVYGFAQVGFGCGFLAGCTAAVLNRLRRLEWQLDNLQVRQVQSVEPQTQVPPPVAKIKPPVTRPPQTE
jgi:hypothetical protein